MNRQDDIHSPSGHAWYLLQCRARQDSRAAQHLANQGYTCYQPLVQVERLQAGKRRLCTEPLFPGYLFIRLCHRNDNWGPIRSTRGVARLVGFNGHPQPVPSEVVDALQARLASAPVISPLQPGDPVRITHGAFANIDAIFQRFDGDERVVILLHLLQRPQPVVVSVSSIEKREGAEG